MTYVPDWEGVDHAIERLLGAGYSLNGAKKGLVEAIADGKIHFRVEIAEMYPPGQTFELGEIKLSNDISVPVHLEADDFDWSAFCPVDWWASAHSKILRYKFKWLELRREDVTRTLLSGKVCPPRRLARATVDQIRVAIAHVSEAATAQGEYAPNLNEIVHPVKELLELDGLTATKEKIQEIAAEEPFSGLRRPIGERISKGAPTRR